jgi:hypothetical protein
VTLEPLKIQGCPGVEPRKGIRTKTMDHFPFALIDFRNIPGSSFEGTMSTLFHKPFMTKFVDYARPKLREIEIWLWIVEDRRAEQVYEIVQKLQPKYAVSISHYIAKPTKGAYKTLSDKKPKVINVLCLYLVYKAEFLKVPNHPITRMEKIFHIP